MTLFGISPLARSLFHLSSLYDISVSLSISHCNSDALWQDLPGVLFEISLTSITCTINRMETLLFNNCLQRTFWLVVHAIKLHISLAFPKSDKQFSGTFTFRYIIKIASWYVLRCLVRKEAYLFVCLFVCLFVWSFSSHSRFFHLFWDVTITSEGLQILTYTRHSGHWAVRVL